MVIHPPDARTSHLRTLSKILGSGLSAWSRTSPPKCPREPLIIPAFPGTSTPREEFFSFPPTRFSGCFRWPAVAGRALCTAPRDLGRGSVVLTVNGPRGKVGRGFHGPCPMTRQTPRFLLALRARLLPLALLLLAGCASGAWVEPGGQRYSVEIADDDAERARGRMFRDALPADHGMLFVHEREEPQAYWMKNTRIPLDILYFDNER